MKTTLDIDGELWTYREMRASKVRVKGKKCLGCCWPAKREIRVVKKVTGLNGLNTDLHELRHATSDFLDEDFVTREANDVSAALWKLGYRKLTTEQLRTLGID